MKYPTKFYKTMRAYLKAVGSRYVEADAFFDSNASSVLCSKVDPTHRKVRFFYAKPSPELRREKAIEFANHHWKSKDTERLQALIDGCRADFSYLQCFYVGEDYMSTSLSGPAYDYCRRQFTKSVWR